jgi:hypothetical protein
MPRTPPFFSVFTFLEDERLNSSHAMYTDQKKKKKNENKKKEKKTKRHK